LCALQPVSRNRISPELDNPGDKSFYTTLSPHRVKSLPDG